MKEKVFIQTYGCAHNQSDSEAMAGVIEKKGFVITKNPDEADVMLVNSCTVKTPSENSLFRSIRNTNKKTILAGCVPQADMKMLHERFKDNSVIGVFQLHQAGEVVEQTLQGNIVHAIAREKDRKSRLNLPRIRRNKNIEIIPINMGCLGTCTYCKTKFARGDLFSYDEEEILKIINTTDAKEIWLTSEDTGAYGLDTGSTLPKLLRRILSSENEFKLRLGMCNPNWVYKYLDELVEIFKHPKMFKFLHIPVQSGNNKILEQMKREYTREEYIEITKRFRKEIPDITISTDIIVAFPGETDEDFEETMNLVRETKPNVLNVSRFWARPGTAAAKLKMVLGMTSKERAIAVSDLFGEIAAQENKKWKDWRGKIFLDEIGKNNTLVGRNYAYKPIIISGDYELGTEVTVQVKETTKHDFRAEVIN